MDKHVWVAWLIGLGMLLGAILLAGCVAPAEITPVPPTPTLAVKSTVSPGQPTPAAPGQAVRFPIPATVSAPPALADNSNCITCHTNAETLQAVAKKVEKKESHSEGEG